MAKHCHHHHAHEHGDHGAETPTLLPLLISAVLLVAIVVIEYLTGWWGSVWLRSLLYLVALLPVWLPVLLEAWELLREEHSFFNENTLMSIAAIGAFAIGEQPEAVMLMLLYHIGEYLQGTAVHKARHDIARLADVRSDTVQLITETGTTQIPAKEAKVGDKLRVLAGMRVSLDGRLLSESALLDQSALTGESMPVERERGEEVLAGSLVSTRPIDIIVTKPYENSTLAHIIQMSEEASERKPQTERLIRRFARVYTPIVFALALLLLLVPWLVGLLYSGYTFVFSDWFYRSLIFLVVSCPCALVISVPLTYFSGMGASSRHGLLFKGALFLEELRRVTTVVFDKTGTLTEGQFQVKEVRTAGMSSTEALSIISAIEANSSHPIAVAIKAHTGTLPSISVCDIEEVAGMGLSARGTNGKQLLVGSERMMQREGIAVPEALSPQGETAVLLAVDNQVRAVVLLADQIKGSSKSTIQELRTLGIKSVVMLSGDRPEVVRTTARELGIDDARGGLLPSDKMDAVAQLIKGARVAFVGDGLNDAPVMSMSHIGIAMGGIATDATIEAADIVIQGTDPHKVVEGVKIARHTHKIVLQNIIFALGFKLLVMVLALFGIASLTLAIIADVGVTLLAILNALRALYFRAKRTR